MSGDPYCLDDCMDYDPCPCDDCIDRDMCDGWEARYCCTLCRWLYDYPDCSDCDPAEI